MSDPTELASFLLRTGAYGLTLWALALAGWPLVRRALPHAPGSLRLASLLMTLFALNTLVVEALGLAGLLRTRYYLVACALLGLAAVFFGDARQSHATLCRLLAAQVRIRSRPRLVAPAAALFLLFLLYCVLLVDGTDSLTLHGPWIVEMIQSGRLLLSTQYNYPLLWECQYVPAFMILGSDVLAVVPRALMALLMLLLVHAAARRLGVPGAGAAMVAWLCMFSPMVWRSGSLKSDSAFAVAILVSLMAAERIWRGHQGGLFLALLSGFFLVGSKATGFLYAGLLSGSALALYVLRTPGDWRIRLRRTAVLMSAAFLILALPATMQIANFLRTGSPVHPIAIRIGGFTIFPGWDLSGTSILEHAGDGETWRQFVTGAIRAAGPEFPVLMLVFVAAWITAGVSSLRVRGSGKPAAGRRTALLFFGCCAASILWFLFLRTPWSRGNAPDNLGYLKGGQSLRYATGQLFLTYILVAAFLRQQFGGRFCRFVGGFAIPALIVYKWYERGLIIKVLRQSELLWGFVALTVLILLAYNLRRGGVLGTVFERRALGPLRRVLLVGVVVTSLSIFVQQVEAERQTFWMTPCRGVWEKVRAHIPAGSEIALNRQHPNYRYLLYGADLSNVLVHPPQPQFVSWLEQSGVRFLYYKANRRNPELDTQLLALLHTQGWVTIGQCQAREALLLERRVPPPPPHPGPPEGTSDPAS